jgi:hypothetical protein
LMMVGGKCPDVLLKYQVWIADTTGLMMVACKCPDPFPYYQVWIADTNRLMILVGKYTSFIVMVHYLQFLPHPT